MRQGGAGQNKAHGRVEDRDRIDSFDTSYQAFQLFGCKRLPFIRVDNLVVIPGPEVELELDHIQNAAGRQTFFLCPSCGRRVRFLYLPEYECRKCCRLNYKSQQVTKGSFEALAAIPAMLDVQGPIDDIEGVGEYDLPRPWYMHKKRFARYVERFRLHQARYLDREQRQLVKILRGTMIGQEYMRLLDGASENDQG